MIGIKRPAVSTVISMPQTGGSSSGISCCFFSCCTCINWQFVKSQTGLMKFGELILGSFCQSLAINYGLSYATTIGSSYHGFLTTASWCLMNTFLLVLCYIFSEKSFYLVKQSLFETVFNAIASFSYLSSSSYLGFSVNTFLYPLYLITPFFQVYPAMTAAYIIGTICGIIHGYDAYKSYRHFKGYR